MDSLLFIIVLFMENQSFEQCVEKYIDQYIGQCTGQYTGQCTEQKNNHVNIDKSINIMPENQKYIQYDSNKSNYTLNRYDHLVIRNGVYPSEPYCDYTFSDIPKSVIRSVKNQHTDIIEGDAGFEDVVLTFTAPGSFNMIVHESIGRDNTPSHNNCDNYNGKCNSKCNENDTLINSNRINIIVTDSNKNNQKCAIS